MGLSWRLPFPLHLISDSSANPVGSTFRLFPESSHFSPLWLPPPQSRPGLSQQLLNGLRGLPCPLVLLRPFPTPTAEGSRGAFEPETEPLMWCALVSHPTWNESSMKADGRPAPCQTLSPPLSPAHSTPLVSLVSSDVAASLRPSWVSPDRFQALLPLLSFLSVSPSHGALVAPLLLCLPCCTVNASRWPGPCPCPQGPTCAWGSGRLGEGVKSGAYERGGGVPPGRGWSWLRACLSPLPQPQARRSPPKGVRSEVLVMTGMAAQEVGPGEHVPQMAQMLCVTVLVNDRARPVLGSCFSHPSSLPGPHGVYLPGTLRAPRSSVRPGLEAPG